MTLKIAGKAIDEDYVRELQSVIRDEGLMDAVEFLGQCETEKLLELYRNCKLFVFPSTVETFGNPLVEAMACGAPIVSSNTAAMPEILGNAAVYFDPLNASEMAAQIIRLLGNETLSGNETARERLSHNALMRARRFSWAMTARQTAEVIKSAAAPNRYHKIDGGTRSVESSVGAGS